MNARERLAAIPHLEVSRRTEVVPAREGVGEHVAHVATTACGREMPTTLVTRAVERVHCPDCKGVTMPTNLGCHCPSDCNCRAPEWMHRPVSCGCRQEHQ